jgi:hypothetical protein
LEEEKVILIAQKGIREPIGRVPVRFNPNKAFPNADQIITARDQAEKMCCIELAKTGANLPGKKRKKH